MQKVGSHLLSHAGIYHLIKTDKETFERIRQRFMSRKWMNEPIETQVKEISHNIRNKYYNNQRSIIPNQLSLI